MPNERMAPDVLLPDTAGFTSPLVTAIQDDPDSPDGSWLTAGSNTATVCHVSFSTPTATLDDSAGAQEFRCLVRKTAQSTAPSATVRLYVNGVDTAEVVGSTTVTGQMVLAGTWSSSGIAASQVECWVTGTPGGGSPGNRASVEVGAVEWNAATVAGGGSTNAAAEQGSGATVANKPRVGGRGRSASVVTGDLRVETPAIA